MGAGSVRVGDVELVPEEEYVRSEIHNRLGGQRYGGISTPARYPVVLIFSSESGKAHGYGFDGWQGRDVFSYTGEGHPEHGDMTFTRGNKAIRDHTQEGKRLLLFERARSGGGRVTFVGEMVCRGYHDETHDTLGIGRL